MSAPDAEDALTTDRDRRASPDYVKLVVLLMIVALFVLAGAYFVLAGIQGMAEIPQQFLLSVIGNIVPVLIVATLSLTALRRILAAYRHAELVELPETISAGLADELQAHDRPGLSEIKSDLSRELRDTLVDDDFIHRLTRSADVRRPLLDDARVAIVGDIIHMMSVALIFPQPPHSVFLRTFCHIADRTNQSLRPICMWSSDRETEDYDAVIPYTGPESTPFVIARALRENTIIRMNLPPNHIKRYSPRLRAKMF